MELPTSHKGTSGQLNADIGASVVPRASDRPVKDGAVGSFQMGSYLALPPFADLSIPYYKGRESVFQILRGLS
jgi:hypothetical protein